MFLHALLFICCLTAHSSAFGYFSNETRLSENIAFLVEKLMPQGTDRINIYYSADGVNKNPTSDALNAILRALQTLAPVSLGGPHVFRQFGFIFTDSLGYLGETLASFRRIRNEERGSLLVYFSVPLTEQDLQEIFNYCLQVHIINIHVVVEVGDGLNLITYFPFTQEQCFGYEPTVICVNRGAGWRRSHEDGGECNLSLKKLSNFHGCLFSVKAFLSPPHLFLQRDGFLTGLEADILKTMSETLNFSMVFLTHNVTHIAQRFHVLNSGHLADISLGRLRTTTVQQRNISSSFAYCNSKLLLVIHSGRSPYSFERVLRPVTPTVWLLMITFSSLAYVGVQILNFAVPSLRNSVFGLNNRYPMYWAWVLMWGGPVELRPRRSFTRTLLINWILLHFFMKCGYQSFVYTSIRTDWKLSTPATFMGVVRDGYTLTASLETYRSLLHIRYLPPLIRTYEHSDMEALHWLEQQDESKIGVIVPKEVYRFHLGRNRASNLVVVGKPLLEQMISMHFKEQSYLKDPFDLVLGRMQISGLLRHWVEFYLSSAKRLTAGASEPKRLSLADVQGHFQLYGIWVVVSLIGLLLEFLSLRVSLLRGFYTRN